MGRTTIRWDDAPLLAILQAITEAHHRYPDNNDVFLDTVIADIARVTGRVYGQSTYDRLMRTAFDAEHIKRRPSAPTVQKAIYRYQESAGVIAAGPTLVGATGERHAREPSDAPHDEQIVRTVQPAVREAVAPLQAAVASLGEAIRLKTLTSTAGPGLEFQLELAQASLQEAHARMRRLDEEIAQLRRELGAAEARAKVAETRVADMLASVLGALGASTSSAEALAGIAHRLEGTERFLKQQNDAVRQHVSAEVDGLRRQNQQLRDQVSHLQLENDQYRRALTTRRGSTPAG